MNLNIIKNVVKYISICEKKGGELLMDIELLEHNEVGYSKLIECLKTNNLATINHATGTGKSFILLKYMLNNQDKKIMYMSPRYPINRQILYDHPVDLGIDPNELSHVDSMIYANLVKIEDIEEFVKKYDVFILDEYHRCGAKKWGKVINEIKRLIKEKYPYKKIIGTTATEIRYLDYERNMKNILFDGVEASRLTLVDAILKGILPVPNYISCDLDSLDRLNALKNRIDKFIISQDEKDEIFSEIELLEDEIRKIFFESEDIKKFLKNDGKVLVFSQSINAINDDKKRIKNFFSNCDVVEYEIHSGKDQEENQKILDEFRYVKPDGKVHILYSINILSEGVHVKDVETEFQCRKTSSPIIFFQFLGRLLSYSQRKKEVAIFDLVNNLQNHRVIYDFFNEICTKAKELIITDPNNKAKYEEIMSKLSLIDKSSIIYKKIDALNEKYSKENLIRKLITDSLNSFENNSNYLELIKCESIIKKYYKYIDITLFRKIKKLKILQEQNLFKLSEKEFIDLLKGYDNLYELLMVKYKRCFSRINEFMINNYRIPSLFSDNEEEVSLAKEMVINSSRFTINQMKTIKSYITEDDTYYEQISYNNEAEGIDLKDLYKETEYIMSLNLPINKKVLEFFKKYSINNLLVKKLEEYNLKIFREMIDDEINLDELNLISTTTGETSELYRKLVDYVINKANNVGIDRLLRDVYKEIEKFVKTYKALPEYISSFKPDYKHNNEESTRLYLLMKILNNMFETYGYKDKIEDLLFNIKKQEIDKIVEKVIEFIKSNNYRMPSIKGSTYEEVSLAYSFSKVKSKLSSEQSEMINSYLRINNEKKSNLITQVYNFILQNIGKPTIFSEDSKLLLEEYKEFENNFTEAEKNIINRIKMIAQIYYFVVSHNYEMPSTRNDNVYEQSLARYYSFVKSSLTEEEKELFRLFYDNLDKLKNEFIERYKEFVRNNCRKPLIINEEEKELVFSYNRWLPFLTKQEINELNRIQGGKYKSFKNAYDIMKGLKNNGNF